MISLPAGDNSPSLVRFFRLNFFWENFSLAHFWLGMKGKAKYSIMMTTGAVTVTPLKQQNRTLI